MSIMKKITAIFMTIAFVLMLMPNTAYADGITLSDGDTYDISQAASGDRIYIESGASVTLTGTNRVSVSCQSNVELTLDNVNINGDQASGIPLELSRGDTILNLVGTSTLAGYSGYFNSYNDYREGKDAIQAYGNLTINGSGTLNVYGGKSRAAIYCTGTLTSNITGTINATYQNEDRNLACVGIMGTNLIVNSGTINAKSASGKSGIKMTGTIDIYDGVINALGINGGGLHGDIINIWEGEITARAYSIYAAIGGYRSGTVNISGGTITATAYDGAAIGGGGLSNDRSYINISGGTVAATSTGRGAAIGDGYDGGGASVTISGDADITATGGEDGTTIGSGDSTEAAQVEITGGTVVVNSGTYGGGIGAFSTEGTSTVTISGGSVTVNKNSYSYTNGMGIGGRRTNVYISGGMVKTGAGNRSYGIQGLDISITGGAKVTSTSKDGSAMFGKNITISDGAEVSLEGGRYGYGIEAAGITGATIDIDDATVFAKASGGGIYGGICGDIMISGTSRVFGSSYFEDNIIGSEENPVVIQDTAILLLEDNEEINYLDSSVTHAYDNSLEINIDDSTANGWEVPQEWLEDASAGYFPAYRVQYDGNGHDGGTVPEDTKNYQTGDIVTVLSDEPTKSGYIFDGWSEGDNLYHANDTFETADYSPTLTAQWTLRDYSVTYFGNGSDSGSDIVDDTVYHMGDWVTVVEDTPTKTGHTFKGWSYGEDIYEGGDVFQMAAESVIFTAQWEANKYKVTFDADGGEVNPEYQDKLFAGTYGTASDGETPQPLPIPTRKGYTFKGWWTRQDGTGTKIDDDSIVTSGYSHTIFASWAADVYTVSFDADAGEVTPATQDKLFDSTYGRASDGETYQSLPVPTRRGYTFGGWWTGEDGSGTKITDSATVSIERNHTLYAKWTQTTYNITYNLDGGVNGDNPSSYVISDTPISLEDARRVGYAFEGWYTESSFTNEVTQIEEKNIGDVTLWAKWTKTIYNIIYNLEGGVNGANPASYDISDLPISIKDAARTGYTFRGWYSEASLKNKVDEIAEGSTEDLELWAKWTENTYKITYHLGGGANGSNPSTYTVETPAITFQNARRKGYEFLGWYSNSSFAYEVKEIAAGSIGDQELWAKWAENIYTITYNLDGGTNGANPGNYGISDTPLDLSAATKSGYIFSGWYTEPTLTNEVTNITSGSTGNITLYAKWELLKSPAPSASKAYATPSKTAESTASPTGDQTGEPIPTFTSDIISDIKRTGHKTTMIIDVGSLQEGISALKLPNGEIISTDIAKDGKLEIQIEDNWVDEDGDIEIVFVDDTQTARGYFSIDVPFETEPKKNFPLWIFVLLAAVIASWFVVLLKKNSKEDHNNRKSRRYN